MNGGEGSTASERFVGGGVGGRQALWAALAAILALAVAAALLLAGYLMLAPTQSGVVGSTGARAQLLIRGNQFRQTIAGQVRRTDSGAVIVRLAEGNGDSQALLSTRQLIAAADHPFLRYRFEGWHPGMQLTLFWRRADSPRQFHHIDLRPTGGGAQWQELAAHPEWRGSVVELAFGVFGELRGPAILREIALLPYRPGHLLATRWQQWQSLHLWDQRSINYYRGVADDSVLPPVPAAAAWAVTAWLLLGAVHGIRRHSSRRQTLLAAAMVLGGVWLALDSLWLRQLFLQNAETRHQFAGKSLQEKKLADWDGAHYAADPAIREQLAGQPGRLVALYVPGADLFAQRLRFHLLPAIAVGKVRRIGKSWIRHASQGYDYVLVVATPGEDPVHSPETASLLTKAPDWTLLLREGPVALFATARGAEARAESAATADSADSAASAASVKTAAGGAAR